MPFNNLGLWEANYRGQVDDLKLLRSTVCMCCFMHMSVHEATDVAQLARVS